MTRHGEFVGTDDTIPVGVVFPLALAVVPSGWQLCDGSIATSPALLAALDRDGRPHGGSAGAGLVPDMRGRGPLGVGTATGGTQTPTGATAHTLGQKEGEEKHAITVPELAAHDHGATTGAAGSHGHALSITVFATPNGTGGIAGASGGGTAIDHGSTADSVGNHSHSVSSQGSGTPHNSLAPYIGLNFIIKL